MFYGTVGMKLLKITDISIESLQIATFSIAKILWRVQKHCPCERMTTLATSVTPSSTRVMPWQLV